MKTGYDQKLLDHLGELVQLATFLVSGREFSPQDFYDCQLSALNVARVFGPVAVKWSAIFEMAPCDFSGASMLYGGLTSLRRAVNADLLTQVEFLVRAEVFDDLLEQADHLCEKQYFLAAGVLGRGVLEEHLRQWCSDQNCCPSKPKPTINDFKESLYVAKHLDKLTMKHVDAMAAIGNEAAHNLPTLTPEHVERLLRDVRQFITQRH